MHRIRFAMVALVASAFAAVALGQNADKNSAGPTKNDYRLRVIEPAPDSTITGSTVRVVVNTEIPADVGQERRDVNSMPRPDVDVFLDGDLKGTMRDVNNVLEVDSVNAGPHELILLAKNRANEIIDRKVIKFSSAPSVGSTTTTSGDTIAGAASTDGAWTLTEKPATQTAAVAPPPAPRPAPVEVAPARPVSNPPPAPRTARYEAAPRTLPDTASSYPTLALVGAGFLLAGFLLRRLQ